jgi:UDP-GlcNAc:undecaprenyl-phosphate/decaprenyl-phosphate GlcNAc-1-phosphate transferase
MLVLLVLSFLVSLGFCVLLMVYGRSRAQLYGQDMPQRFHAGDVPRFGGLAIAAGCVLAWAVGAAAPWLGLAINVDLNWNVTGLWALVLAPVVTGGAWEDYTLKVGVRWRLVASLVSALLGCALLGLTVPRLGLPALDGGWQMIPWLGVALGFVALAGLPHAFNIIDGYNGLAGIVAVMVLCALTYVALQLGDRMLAALIVATLGATLGFLYWNYPRGLIFAGDCGAYLWGSVIAMACLTLVQRHASVSPWFPMLLLIYPVWETLFSIYRKLVRGVSPGMADSLHFHQLVYKRIVRGVFHDNETRRLLTRNNRTSPYLWAFTTLTVVPAVLFWQNTVVLMLFCLLFVVSYVAAYLMIVRFKVPRWLRK